MNVQNENIDLPSQTSSRAECGQENNYHVSTTDERIVGESENNIADSAIGELVNKKCEDSSGEQYILLVDDSEANNDCENNEEDTTAYFRGTDKRLDDDNAESVFECKESEHVKNDSPDGGWGWVVTFSALVVCVILDGISFSFGLFFNDLYTYFGESKTTTSWITSVMNGTYMVIGPVASVLVAAYGSRKVAIFGAILAAVAFFLCTWSPNVHVMILLYGLLGGGGLGLLYSPSIVTVGHYFAKKRALATGIAVCGSGIGGFVFAPLSEFLIEYYSWKGAMWIISAIVLNGVVVAASYRPLKGHGGKRKRRNAGDVRKQSEKGENCDAEKNAQKCCDISAMFDFELLRSPTFLVYGCSCFLCMLGFFIPFTYIPDLAEELGMTSQQSAMVISIIGILNTVARVIVGWVADQKWADTLVINSVALVIGGVATICVPTYTSFGILVTYAVVFGVSIAVFVTLRSIVVTELLTEDKLTSSFGLVMLCQGMASFIGAPIAGALTDVSGDYRGAFYFAGIAIALSGMICFPLRRISMWEKRRKSQKKTDL